MARSSDGPGRLMGRSAATALLVLIAGSAQAQSTNGLGGLLLRFFSPANPVILQEAQPFNHAAHFQSQAEAGVTLQRINTAIATQLSTFPLGSSAGGFTYTFNPELGVFSRSSESFGPSFTERALTAGKGKLSFGFNALQATYDEIDGKDLDGGGINLYLRHIDTNNDNSNLAPWFEGDLIRSDLFLSLERRSAVLFANYGVTENFDVGVAVPYVSIDFSARIHASVDPVASSVDPFTIHIFPGGAPEKDFTESGTADGIGDLVLRGKYHFLGRSNTHLALGADVRLPTGKEEDLLGSGTTQSKLYLVYQGGTKRLSPHLNVGYTLSSGKSTVSGELPDEINYAAGFDAVLHPKVTFSADFIGRTLRDASRLVDVENTYQFTRRLTPTLVEQTTRSQTTVESANVSLYLGAAGLKFNPFGRILVNASVLFAFGENGLQDKVTPVVGIDYTF